MATIATTDPVTSKGAIAGIDPSSAQMANQASNTLTSHSVYPGVVREVNYATMKLTVEVNRAVLADVSFASNALAGYFGFTTSTLPAVGAQVLVVYIPGASWCVGLSSKIMDNVTEFTGMACGDVTKEEETLSSAALQVKSELPAQVVSPGLPLPEDMVPGEAELGIGAGACMRLLMNFVQMSAGNLALIETCLLNDMVRIVSNYFVHHHCGGDDLIWSAGRCNSESHFTSYPFEADGKEDEQDELAKEAGQYVVDPLKSCENPASDTGRWRVSRYLGFLGDIIHLWVTDPTKVISSYMEEATRAGKCRAWVGMDGTVMVQSVGGVHIEVAPKVVIPAVHMAWNDPAFDWEAAMEKLNTEYLKMWGTGPNYDDMKVAVWQMRSYAKYLTLWHSLRRWHQLAEKGYCTVPTEAEAEIASPVSEEADKKSVNPKNTEPVGGYASISILPDGSLSVNSGGDTSVIMHQGNIQINAPGNIEINAGGTVSISSKAISAKAVNHVELVSLAGGLYLKARTAWHALCERGRVWLKSDARPGEADGGRSATDGPIETYPEMAQCGVILDAAESHALVSGKTGAILASTGPGARTQVQALGAGGDVSVFGSIVSVLSSTVYRLKAKAWAVASSVAKIASLDIKLGDSVRATPTGVITDKFVMAQTMAAKGVYISPTKYNLPPKDPIILDMKSGADEIGNEAQSLRQDDLIYDADADELSQFKWSFPDWYVASSVTSPDSLKAGAVYDKGQADPDWQYSNFNEVQWDRCTLEPGPRTDTSKTPWPGKNAKMFVFNKPALPALGEEWEMPYSTSDIGKVADMKQVPYTFLVNKY